MKGNAVKLTPEMGCLAFQVLGGADLFLQGLIIPEGGLGHFSAGDLRVVCIPQNAYPFAVGQMEVSSDDVARTGCVRWLCFSAVWQASGL